MGQRSATGVPVVPAIAQGYSWGLINLGSGVLFLCFNNMPKMWSVMPPAHVARRKPASKAKARPKTTKAGRARRARKPTAFIETNYATHDWYAWPGLSAAPPPSKPRGKTQTALPRIRTVRIPLTQKQSQRPVSKPSAGGVKDTGKGKEKGPPDLEALMRQMPTGLPRVKARKQVQAQHDLNQVFSVMAPATPGFAHAGRSFTTHLPRATAENVDYVITNLRLMDREPELEAAYAYLDTMRSPRDRQALDAGAQWFRNVAVALQNRHGFQGPFSAGEDEPGARSRLPRRAASTASGMEELQADREALEALSWQSSGSFESTQSVSSAGSWQIGATPPSPAARQDQQGYNLRTRRDTSSTARSLATPIPSPSPTHARRISVIREEGSPAVASRTRRSARSSKITGRGSAGAAQHRVFFPKLVRSENV